MYAIANHLLLSATPLCAVNIVFAPTRDGLARATSITYSDLDDTEPVLFPPITFNVGEIIMTWRDRRDIKIDRVYGNSVICLFQTISCRRKSMSPSSPKYHRCYSTTRTGSVSKNTHLNQRSPLRDMSEIRLILWGCTSDVSQTCEFLILPVCLINYNARRPQVARSWICTLRGGFMESIYGLALNRDRISPLQTHAIQLRTIDRRWAPDYHRDVCIKESKDHYYSNCCGFITIVGSQNCALPLALEIVHATFRGWIRRGIILEI